MHGIYSAGGIRVIRAGFIRVFYRGFPLADSAAPDLFAELA
jgi:hypothetical protein